MPPYTRSIGIRSMEQSVSKRPPSPADSRGSYSDDGSNRPEHARSSSFLVVKPPAIMPFDFAPRSIDIVCGRGKASTRHNTRYADLLRQNSEPYKETERKSERSAIIANLVATLRAEGSMFVKYDEASGQWYDIGDREARKKCGHAIRDRLNQNGNPVRGSKAKAAAARKKRKSASCSVERPKLRRKRRGGRKKQPPPGAGKLKDDNEGYEAEGPANITDSADTTICAPDDPIDLALHEGAHHDDSMLFDDNLLDGTEDLRELEGGGSHHNHQPLVLDSGGEFTSASASPFPDASNRYPGSNLQHFEMWNTHLLHSGMSLPPHYTSTMMQLPLMGTVPLPQNNSVNTLDNSIVPIQSMMNNSQQHQTPYGIFGSNVDAYPNNPLRPSASYAHTRQPIQQSSTTAGAIKSTDTSMEPLPLDAAESNRYAIMNGGMLDGKIQAAHSFDTEAIYPENHTSAHQRGAREDHYSFKEEKHMRKACVDGNGQSSADNAHLKSDDGQHDVFSGDIFEH